MWSCYRSTPKISSSIFLIGSTNNPPADILLNSNDLCAWYYTNIVKRNYFLVIHGLTTGVSNILTSGIQSVTIRASHLMVNVTGRFVINCTVIGGPPDLQITWSKGGNIIGLSHRTKVETNRGYSRLTVRDAMASDEGVYVCQAG